jgi:hypothetical protein
MAAAAATAAGGWGLNRSHSAMEASQQACSIGTATTQVGAALLPWEPNGRMAVCRPVCTWTPCQQLVYTRHVWLEQGTHGWRPRGVLQVEGRATLELHHGSGLHLQAGECPARPDVSKQKASSSRERLQQSVDTNCSVRAPVPAAAL